MASKGEVYVGGTDLGGKFGNGWIGSGEVTKRFPGAIPYSEIQQNLLNWEPIEVPNANLIPVSLEDGFDTIVNGQAYKVLVQRDKKAIVRSDTYAPLGVFGNGYDSRAYQKLVDFTQRAYGAYLPPYNVGLLGGGTKFFIQLGLDETMHDPESGVEFMPFLLFGSSLDGTLANTWSTGSQVLICNNMFSASRSAAKADGRLFKIKRSRNGFDDANMANLQDALGVLRAEKDQFMADVQRLVRTPVTNRQFEKVLDIKMPLAGEDASKAAKTRSENRRASVKGLYHNSPMVSPWAGTAWGVVQAFNTDRHYGGTVKMVTRTERIFERALTSDISSGDTETIEAIDRVLALA